MQPQMVKAAYLTYFGIGDKGIRGRVLDLAARTELNAVVIDVKGDRGWIVYRTEVPEALAVGAQGPGTLKDFDSLMADLKSRGIYTIGRIVTFKDNVLANGRPDLAIIDTRTGRPWIDNEKLAWVDPFREEVWRYNVAIAREAASKGFDEIQFDYVRFPTDGKLGAAKYSSPNNKTTRLPAIAGFLGKAPPRAGSAGGVRRRRRLRLHGVQRERHRHRPAHRGAGAAPRLSLPDGLSLRLPRGDPGVPQPVQNPTRWSGERPADPAPRLTAPRARAAVAAGLQRLRVRPADLRRDRGPRADQGADDAGAVGWMLWNPGTTTRPAALRQKEASGTK